jgi:hypothetical protein
LELGRLGGGLITGLLFGLLSWFLFVQDVRLSFGLIGGLLFGLYVGLSNGGIACIQHFTLRLFLWRAGDAPWDYARFLNHATERILLRKIGGGYIFAHRLLLEYFAPLDIAFKAGNSELTSPKQVDACDCGYKEPRSEARFCSNCGKLK